jgi:Carboxypeptidase regulatory-like domain
MICNDSMERKTRNFLRCYLSLTVAVGISGCGGGSPLSAAKAYPVTGKVLLPDGKPLTSGNVVFVATKSTVSSLAKIENDGSFTLNGLPEGEYKVRLEIGESSRAKKGSPPFPSKYLDEDGSDLAATVKPVESANRFELKLTQNGSQKSSPRGSR